IYDLRFYDSYIVTTCFLRYTINPEELPAFEHRARVWMRLEIKLPNNLGRWRRLLHFAPLALSLNINGRFIIHDPNQIANCQSPAARASDYGLRYDSRRLNCLYEFA